ncbi:hypothetical protein E4U47_005172, partial [Claviceps purpurea]
MPEDDPVKFLLAAELEPYLHEAGSENIHCQIMRVPLGPWAKDITMRVIGIYQRLAAIEILPSLSGRLFEPLGMSEAEVEVTLAMARKGLDGPDVHRYFNFYF